MLHRTTDNAHTPREREEPAMADWSEIGGWLLHSARGTSWREEAACWLLAEQGCGTSRWPDRLHTAGLTWTTYLDDKEYDLLHVRWDDLARTLADDAHGQLHGTRAELCVLRFACHLVTGQGGDWAADLSSCDTINRRLLHGALAWAAGGEAAAYPYFSPDQNMTDQRQ